MGMGHVSEFGTLLKRFRLAANLSQEALAERAGLSVRAISDLERGARRTPRPETIALLAEALALSAADRAALVAPVLRRRLPAEATLATAPVTTPSSRPRRQARQRRPGWSGASARSRRWHGCCATARASSP